MSTDEKKVRERVIVFLLFLTSEESLKACHRFITPEKLSLRLARMWFDEIYMPGTRYLNGGLKGDYSEEEVEKFHDNFSDGELKALERFHRFFELRLEMIPASSRRTSPEVIPASFGKNGIWPQNNSWSNVLRDARNLLSLFALDADALRSETFEMFMQALGKSLDFPDLREVFIRKN